jgi:hypothetical protein
MNRITLMLVALFALLLGTTSTLQAQAQCPANSCSLSFSASVTVQSIISCSVIRGSLNFGSHLKSEGKVSLDETTAGLARCTIDPSNGVVDVSFTLPSSLTRSGGTETVPITFGNESLRLRDCDCYGSIVQGVNPAVGQSKSITSGFMTLALGQNGPNDPAGEVSVNLSSAPAAGTYTGFITATVALR